MFRGRKEKYDVAILGAGVTGLMLAKKLSELGVKVALIEKDDKVAGGPSTRNEGWLHRGTYHATSIEDRATAIQVARRCIYGHEQIRRFAPEAVEDPDVPSFAVVNTPKNVEEVVSRWNEAGVGYKPVPLDDFRQQVPESNVADTAHVFQVEDVGINTRILYQKLLTAGLQAGTRLFLEAETTMRNPNEAKVKTKKRRRGRKNTTIQAKLFIHTTGYSMKDFFAKNYNVDLPMRFWKSHLLVTPRLSKSSVFAVDPGEVGMMNHGDYSIVGANEDAVLVESPNYGVMEERVLKVEQAMRRLYRVDDTLQTHPVACIKVDMPLQNATARSLNINVSEPVPGHICVLPGKMTESAYVTDVVTRMVYERVRRHSYIALRPCDTLRKDE